jgi:hypothetical protein
MKTKNVVGMVNGEYKAPVVEIQKLSWFRRHGSAYLAGLLGGLTVAELNGSGMIRMIIELVKTQVGG